MFTGIVKTQGRITERMRRQGSLRLGIASSLAAADTLPGGSVSVNGACLTVVERRGRRFVADVIPETLSRTTFGELRPGDLVNLEPSLRMGDPLGGHLLAGHVDCSLPVLEVARAGGDWRLRLPLVPELRRYVAEKGSIALQGVSLTVAGVSARHFEVALIPVTRRATTLGSVRSGDRLHVEVDVLARYLERLMPRKGGGAR